VREKGEMARTPRFGILYILASLWLMFLVIDYVQISRSVDVIPYSEFISRVESKDVSEVAIGKERIRGTLKGAPAGKRKEFVTSRVDDPDLTRRLEDSKVKFIGVQESTFWRDLLSWTIPALVLFFILSLFMGRVGQMPRGGGMLPIGKSRAKIYVEKGLKIRFDDVAGVEEAKDELKEVVNFLRDPKRYSKLGGRMPKGVLLVGAPGTGKTLLARAVAGEAGVPFFSINGSEFVELFVGLGAARVRDLFEQARAHAPCIIFIDELDAMGKARGITAITGASNDEKEQTLNQLLAELDGFDPSSGIVLLAATNRPEVLDPALLRAGRFDRQVVLDKPDRLGRRKILEVHLKKIKLAPRIDVEALAGLTAGFSGADLANLVNEAALIATRRGAEAVESEDFNQAIERTVAGLERRSRVLNPAEKKRVAFHEMGHAAVALAVGEDEAVHKVSIIPRGVAALGYTMRRPIEDRYLMSKRELEEKLAVVMGGRASESIFFDDISTGASDDLDKATEIARAMITRYGMSGNIGLATYERENAPFLGSRSSRAFDYSERTAQNIDAEVKNLLNSAFERAKSLIVRYRDVVEDGARILLEKETIDEAELKTLWESVGKARQEEESPPAKPIPVVKLRA
jgi:cell division protease FtsH